MFHPKSEPEVCHDLILKIISYQIKDYMRDHGSVGLFLGNGVFPGGKFFLALNVFGLFEQVTDAQDFG